MSSQLLVTAVGEDRPGIVSRVSEIFVKHGGNIEESRMALLGGDFAAIVLVTGDSSKFPLMEKELAELEEDGITITTKRTAPLPPDRHTNHTACKISLQGADHEGIVHRVSSYLQDYHVNIHLMQTSIARAPVSGTPLFCMEATVMVPPTMAVAELEKDLQELASRLTVDIVLKVANQKEVMAQRA